MKKDSLYFDIEPSAEWLVKSLDCKVKTEEMLCSWNSQVFHRGKIQIFDKEKNYVLWKLFWKICKTTQIRCYATIWRNNHCFGGIRDNNWQKFDPRKFEQKRLCEYFHHFCQLPALVHASRTISQHLGILTQGLVTWELGLEWSRGKAWNYQVMRLTSGY